MVNNKKGNGNKRQGQQSTGPVTSDPRFAHVHRDPRFMRPKHKDSKVAIDKRFASMLNEDEFGAAPKVDKYGRKLKAQSKENEMKRFYRLDEDEEQGSDSDEDGDDGFSSEEDEFKSVEQLEKELAEDEGNLEDEEIDSDEDDEEEPRYDPMRGEGVSSSSESELDSDEEEESEEEDEDVPTGDESRRLALVNLDWDKVKALDILKVLNGFKPSGSVIKAVTVYPSEFGKERMAKEEVEGPPREIFRDSKKRNGADSDSEDEDAEITEKSLLAEQTKDGEDFDSEALRKYQLDRLKYYYAVVECDTIDTARSIYQSCDGAEYERSANFFDLRYIPDEMTFEDEARDLATHAPENYKPVEYVTEALQHSNVKLTWDEDDHERMNMTRRKFTKEDVEHMDFSAYIASSEEEDSDEDLETSQEKYRKLLASLSNGGDGDLHADDGEEAEGDMEITFTPGLSEAANAAISKKNVVEDENETEPAEENTIEKYMRKRKEKRMKKKLAKQNVVNEEQEEESSEGEIDASDPWFKEALDDVVLESADVAKPKAKSKGAKKQTKEERLEEQRKKAELELLLADSANQNDGFDMKEVLKREKLAAKKGKLGKKAKKLLEETDDFEIDAQDPRFAALHESHHFAIDPTNPHFKKTKAMNKLMETRQKKIKNSNGQDEGWNKNSKIAKKDKKDKKSSGQPAAQEEKIKDASLAALVNSVKRKGGWTTANSDSPKGKRNKSN
ncbi:pre-rRNA-processing protein esf1 [Umbelopsis sp. WA50703]